MNTKFNYVVDLVDELGTECSYAEAKNLIKKLVVNEFDFNCDGDINLFEHRNEVTYIVEEINNWNRFLKIKVNVNGRDYVELTVNNYFVLADSFSVNYL